MRFKKLGNISIYELKYLRVANGVKSEYFELQVPATSERIRISCEDEFVRLSDTQINANEQVWAVPG